MTDVVTDSLARVQQKQKIETRTVVKRIAALAIIAAVALFAILGSALLYAQGHDDDKYSLKSPDGIAFADFRGYEDWSTVSSARQVDVLKVIVANSPMIKAFKAGVPLNGKAFPEGSMIVKLQWSPKKDKEAPFDVDVPDAFKQAFVMEKDSKRFPILHPTRTAETRAMWP